MFSGLNLKNEEKAVFALRALYQKYGYIPYKMSKFEEYDLYVRNKNFLVSDSIITFTDTNGKLMALKPDVTLSIVKNTKDAPGCVQKVYYNENVYRISKSTHEFKEIMQTGLECIGDVDAYDVFEVVSLAVQSLAAISDSYILDLSHIGFVSALLDNVDCSDKTRKDIIKCLSEKNQSAIEKICFENGIEKSIEDKLNVLVSSYGKIGDVLPEIEKICDTDELKEIYEEFSELCGLIVDNGLDSSVRVDFSVANDMNYYSGIVFHGFVEGVPTGVLSGGRYDNLMKKMGRKSGAIGFAVYVDLLERLGMTDKRYDVDAMLIYDSSSSAEEVSRAVNKLREQADSVTAQKSVPENIRYKSLYKLEGKEVKILERND
ncbi:MAG: ATP phosphoribosyltransferase regulatory subunit [Clostridia bacterium]|nr:ATP phosphoribosyltransferase regulatory subunit [Clostridia bacterium]